MQPGKRTDFLIACLAIIALAATLACTGCTESAPQQGPGDLPAAKAANNPAPAAASAMRTTGIPSAVPSTLAASDPVLPNAAVTFDPVGIKPAGSSFMVTGRTSLPAGTNLFWQISPDTGTPPTGINMNARSGIMANTQVESGNGSANRVSLSIGEKDAKDLGTGKFVALVVSLKGDPMTTDPSTGTLAGYTYLTLK